MARTKQRQTARKSTGSWSQSAKYTSLMKKLETKTGKGSGKGRKSTVRLIQFSSTLLYLALPCSTLLYLAQYCLKPIADKKLGQRNNFDFNISDV